MVVLPIQLADVVTTASSLVCAGALLKGTTLYIDVFLYLLSCHGYKSIGGLASVFIVWFVF